MEPILLWAVFIVAVVVYAITLAVALAWYRHAQAYKRLHANQRAIAQRYREMLIVQTERTRRWRHAAVLESIRHGTDSATNGGSHE